MAGLIDATNKNNHAGVERREASERAEALLGVINEYRVYSHRFESLPTWDVLEFLSRLEKELFKRYEKEVSDWERDRIRNDYFLLTHKKPFGWWSVEEIKQKMEEFKAETDKKNASLSENYLNTVKKNQWKKAMKK